MRCPICDSKTWVIDAVIRKSGKYKRRHECRECLTRFSTYESIDYDSLPKYVSVKRVVEINSGR